MSTPPKLGGTTCGVCDFSGWMLILKIFVQN